MKRSVKDRYKHCKKLIEWPICAFHMVQAVKQLLRLFCTNGARQRRKLARCLAEWEEVRKEESIPGHL
jgi:hypothetical protein